MKPRVALVVLAIAAAACSAGERTGPAVEGSAAPSTATPALTAQVASYDLSVGRLQRVTVGLVAGEEGLVAYGSVNLAFAPLDEGGTPTAELGLSTVATFLPVPGNIPDPTVTRPQIVSPADMVGVYGAEVRFDRPGPWGVVVTGDVEGEELRATTTLEVLDVALVPVPGDDAPRSANHLPGAPGVPPAAVDSRADDDGRVPDPELHDQTVAEAIASGRPTMVVISTPVYCVSRFCGPITDSVQRLAAGHGDRMNFVHLEVWRDFEAQQINKAAAEWIYRTPPQEINEPWVFVVSGQGQIVERWDNVAPDSELTAAVEQALK